MYPFDTYMLSTTLRAVSFSNEILPIRRLATIPTTTSFNIDTLDTESYSTLPNTQKAGQVTVSRDIDLRVSRPSEARVFTFLLFVASWIFAHTNIGLVILARRLTKARSIFKFVVAAGLILLAIPQIRNSMPDAPGLDGKPAITTLQCHDLNTIS